MNDEPGRAREKRAKKQTRSWPRRILRIAGATLAVVIGLVLVLSGTTYVVLQTDWGREKVREEVESQLRDVFAGDVHIGRLEGNPLDAVTLHDVVVEDRQGNPAIAIDELEIDYALTPLASKRVVIDELALRGVRVIGRDHDGVLNLTELLADADPDEQDEDEGEDGWDVEVRHLSVTGDVELPVAGGGEPLRVAGVTIEGGVSIDGSGAIAASGLEVAAEGSTIALPVGRWDPATGGVVAVGGARLDPRIAERLGVVAPGAPVVDVVFFGARAASGEPIAAHARASARGQSVDVVADVVPEAPSASGSATVTGADLAAWLPGAPASDVAARATFDLTGESLETLAGTVELAADGTIDGHRLDASAATVTAEDGVFRFDVTAEALAATLTARGSARVREGAWSIDEGTLVTATSEDLAATAGTWVDAAGSASIEARPQGPLSALRVDGTVEGEALRYEVHRAGSLALSFDARDVLGDPQADVDLAVRGARSAGTYFGRATAVASLARSGDAVRVSGLELRSAPARLFADALVGSEAQRADIRTLRLDLAAVSAIAGTPGPRGTIVARGRVSRAGTALDADLGVTARGVAASADTPAFDGRGRVRLADRALAVDVDAASAEIAAVDLELRARTPVDATDTAAWRRAGERSIRRLHAVIRDVDVAAAARLAGRDEARAGRGKATITYDGATRRGRIDADLSGLSVPVARLSSARADLAITLDGTDLQLRATADAGPWGTVDLEARAETPPRLTDVDAWRRDPARHLRRATLRVHELSVTPERLARLGIDEQISGRAELTAEVGDRASVARVRVRARDLVTRYFDTSARIDADAVLTGGRSTLEVRARAPNRANAELTAEFRSPANLIDAGAWRALDERAVRFGRLTASALIDPELLARLGVDARAVGRADLTVEASDRLASTDVELDVRVADNEWIDNKVAASVRGTVTDARTDIETRVAIDGRRAVSGRAEVAAGLVSVWHGGLEALERARVRGTVDVERLPLPVIADALDAPAETSGVLVAKATLGGSVAGPTARVEANTVDAAVAGVELPELRGNADVTTETIDGSVTAVQGSGGSLTASLEVGAPRPAGRTLRGALVAERFDLAPLSVFAPGLAGTLAGKLDARGTAEAPRVAGQLRVRGFAIDTLGPVDRIRRGEATLVVNPKRATLVASARAGRGSLSVDATADLADLDIATVRADLRAKKVEVHTESSSLVLDAEATTALRRGANGGITGRLDIEDAVVVLPEQSGTRDLHPTGQLEDVVVVRRNARGEIIEPDEDRARRSESSMPIVLTVRAPSTLVVRAPEGRAVLDVDLVVTMAGQTRGRGTVVSNEGIVELFGHRYRIDHLIASFDGGSIDDPRIDIRLTRELGNATMYIDIGGTPEDPELELVSDPPIYGDAQLLSFVLGGDPDDPDAADRTAGSRAASAAAGLVTSRVQDMVKDRLPIDVLRVEMSEETAQAAKVTIGKWITSKLFISYRHRFEARENENDEEATFEWRFFRHWLLEGYFGDEGAAGADVLWQKRY